MAVGTGMGTGLGNGNNKKTVTQKEAMASLTQEEREKVAKAKFPMELANALRLLFIVVAVMGLLFIFFGGKFWEGIAWFESAKQSVYNFLLWTSHDRKRTGNRKKAGTAHTNSASGA